MSVFQAQGGPAFPLTFTDKKSSGVASTEVYPGMSLRDYFAACALQALLSNPERIFHQDANSGPVPEVQVVQAAYAHAAYMQADAMLKAREQS